jgi:hypothetical protein
MRSHGPKESTMAERFLGLSLPEQSEILRAEASRLGRNERVLEKDIWVCWALEALFAIPGLPRMAFKGGTSLSKVYGAIHRFSEDVDVSFDFRDLQKETAFKEGPAKMSGERLKKFREALQTSVRRLIKEHVAPHLQETLRQEVGEAAPPLEIDSTGEKLKVPYPTAFERGGYLKEWVLLEFGGRNVTEPCSTHKIQPDIAPHLSGLRFPLAEATVLAPERTFWEKATLIHAECSRGSLRATADRPSRHWYDLAVLADHEIGHRAFADRALLAAVVEHKSWSFKDLKARYQDCLTGRLRLLPEAEAMRVALREDYAAMIQAGMFYSTPPSFGQIEARLRALGEHVNTHPEQG